MNQALVALLALAACGSEDAGLELAPFEELEHPVLSEPLSCSPWRGDYVMPTLEAPSGGLRMETSAKLIPVGVAERIFVRVLTPEATLDTSASGQLSLTSVNGVQIISEGVVSEGYGEIEVEFTEAGVHSLDISLEGDSRVGRSQIEAYEPRLPIWELSADQDEFAEMFDRPAERINIEGTVAVDGELHQTRMRIHGGASRDFPKKSLRLNLDGSELSSGERKVILRAEYNDKSMLRTWLGYELFRNGSYLPTPENEYVHVRLNKRYYGLMNRLERIDERFLQVRGLNPDGNLYEADPPSELAVPGGNLTPLESETDYYRTYQWHAGPGAWTDLIQLIETTLALPQKSFEAVIADEVQLDSYLRYLAAMAVLQNHEHIRKNYYLYRDPEANADGWMALPWDLDLTQGHLWSELDDVLDERITTDADLFVGEFAPERFGYFNQLAERVLKTPVLRERFLQFIAQLLDGAFTEEFYEGRIGYALCLLEPDLLADQEKRASNEEYLERVDEIRFFVRERRAYITAELERLGVLLPAQ